MKTLAARHDLRKFVIVHNYSIVLVVMLLDTLALARNACLLAARVPLPTLLAWPQADTNKLEHSISEIQQASVTQASQKASD